MSNYAEMTGPELVAAFNEMAASPVGSELGTKPVTRFGDRTAGVKRCLALESSIRARRGGLEEEANRNKRKARVDKLVELKQTSEPAQPVKVKKGKAPKKESERRAPDPSSNDVMDAYGVYLTSNRARVLRFLESGKSMPEDHLLWHVYATDDKKFLGKLRMVLKGLFLIQSKHQLKFEVRKIKSERGVEYGLLTK